MMSSIAVLSALVSGMVWLEPQEPRVEGAVTYGAVVTDRRSLLARGGLDYWPVDLSGPGRFSVRAVCGAGCGDIDLGVRNEGNIQIDNDSTTSATPRVSIPNAGRYVISTYMSSCSLPRCDATVTVTREPGPPGDEDVRLAQAIVGEMEVAELLAEVKQIIEDDAATGLVLFDERRTTLSQGASDDWWQQLLPNKDYLVVGFCDNRCDGLEIVSRDGEGKLVSRPVAVGDASMWMTGATMYNLHVRMTSCEVAACVAGFMIFRPR